MIRLSFFFGIFAVMAIWEIATPKRVLTVSKPLRWTNNIGIFVLNSVLLRLLFPAAAAGMAIFAQQQGWGILNYLEVPFWAAIVISLIALDFFIYLQHVMFHAVPTLWRVHRVHHSEEVAETNSNFSINLSIWDRLFGTYLDQPQYSHQGMTIGLCTFRETDQCAKLPGMLSMPFFAKFESYAINRRPFSQQNKISHE